MADTELNLHYHHRHHPQLKWCENRYIANRTFTFDWGAIQNPFTVTQHCLQSCWVQPCFNSSLVSFVWNKRCWKDLKKKIWKDLKCTHIVIFVPICGGICGCAFSLISEYTNLGQPCPLTTTFQQKRAILTMSFFISWKGFSLRIWVNATRILS